MLGIRNQSAKSLRLRRNLDRIESQNPVIVTPEDTAFYQSLRRNLGRAEPSSPSETEIIESLSIRPNANRIRRNLRDGESAEVFNPTQVSGCQLWLDAQDATTTLATEAGFAWRDKSTNNRHAYQNSLSLSPTIETSAINGKRALRFNGSKYLSHPVISTSYTGLTIFAVILVVTAAGYVLWSHRDESTRLIQLTTQTTTDYRLQLRSSTSSLQTVSQTVSTNYHVLCGLLDVANNNHNLYVDNVAGTANTTNFSGQNFNSTKETIGATFVPTNSAFFDGYIGELIIYDRALSGTEISSINLQLATKWA